MFPGIYICCMNLEMQFIRSAQKGSEVTELLDGFDQEIWTDEQC